MSICRCNEKTNIGIDCTGCDHEPACREYMRNREVKRVPIREVDDHGHHEVPGGSTPSQYALPSHASELQDLIEHRDMSFSLGNVFKACYRLGHCGHSDRVRDLNKMKWFIERLIELEATRGR